MKTLATLSLTALIAWAGLGICTAQEATAKKHALLIGGKPSHGQGAHEHNAGVLLLKKCLDESGLPIQTTAKLNAEWPSAAELASADTILIYCDGGRNHLLLQEDRMQQLAKEMKRGCGLICLHYGVEFPKENGGAEMLDWMGGYFEEHWSVNPTWNAEFTKFPQHPISNGLKPYAILDEWYFHMRFADDSKGSRTDILSAIAPDSTMNRKDGPHEGNPEVRKAVAAKIPQSTAWAFVRKDGGRGFGFTGGHYHKNWGDDNQRMLVLNAILWTAKAEVPTAGVQSKVSPEALEANLDPKGAPKKKAQAYLPGDTTNPAYCAACRTTLPVR